MCLVLVQIYNIKCRIDIVHDAYYEEYLNKVNYIPGHTTFGVQANECSSETLGQRHCMNEVRNGVCYWVRVLWRLILQHLKKPLGLCLGLGGGCSEI